MDIDIINNEKKCNLNEYDCVNLLSILKAFNGPISEEQAWAICHQVIITVKNLTKNYENNNWINKSLYTISDPSHIFIHKNGYIHEHSITQKGKNNDRQLANTEFQIIRQLGYSLFQALDYGYSEEYERDFDPLLKELIEKLVPNDDLDKDEIDASLVQEQENDERDLKDEGIGVESFDDLNEINIYQIEKLCRDRLTSPEDAESHYKAVCRALVAEVLELSTFLERISKGTKDLKNCSIVKLTDSSNNEMKAGLKELASADWACLWMQVIKELRNGVKLKKVQNRELNKVEYELTPYEMLLNDIRLKRYKLRKVINNNLSAKLKRDAHDLILEFIRSRPPLMSVKKRKLRSPPPRDRTPHECLLDAIKEKHDLKISPRPKEHCSIQLGRVLNEKEIIESKQMKTERKLIKADINLKLSMTDDEDEDDYYDEKMIDQSLEDDKCLLNQDEIDHKVDVITDETDSTESNQVNSGNFFQNFTRLMSFRRKSTIPVTQTIVKKQEVTKRLSLSSLTKMVDDKCLLNGDHKDVHVTNNQTESTESNQVNSGNFFQNFTRLMSFRRKNTITVTQTTVRKEEMTKKLSLSSL